MQSFHNHEMVKNISGPILQCLSCTKSLNSRKDDFYTCNICCFSLCKNCYFNYKYAPNNNIHQHKLSLTNRLIYNCDKCPKENEVGLSMFCEKCNFGLCPDCYFFGK